MSSIAKRIGNVLRGSPVLFRTGVIIFNFFSGIFKFLLNTYLKLLELLTPAKFFIQSTPDYVISDYKNYKKDAGIFHSGQQNVNRDYTRIVHGKYLLDIVFNLPEGDYAELGTYKGKFAQLIFQYMHPSAHLYCFDTFEGFSEEDVIIEKEKSKLKVKKGFFSDTSVELVKKNILNGKPDTGRLTLVKGYFPKTFSGFENKKWRFVQLDADLYEPMKEGVALFWPNITKGGVLLIHDYYGGYKGTKQAMDEYFIPLGIIPVPLGDKAGTAVVIKQN